MAINLGLIGKKTDPVIFKYSEDQVILYALSIGAGVDELDFIYERNLKVFPTFGVVPLKPIVFYFLEQLNVNLATVLHMEQKISMHRQIPASGKIVIQGCLDSIYDKGDKGAVINLLCEGKGENGELIYETSLAMVDRSNGNFGGNRGPKPEKSMPPEGKLSDFKVDYYVPPNQAALYRLNGDKNPLHIDPEFASTGKFDKPSFTGRAPMAILEERSMS